MFTMNGCCNFAKILWETRKTSTSQCYCGKSHGRSCFSENLKDTSRYIYMYININTWYTLSIQFMNCKFKITLHFAHLNVHLPLTHQTQRTLKYQVLHIWIWVEYSSMSYGTRSLPRVCFSLMMWSTCFILMIAAWQCTHHPFIECFSQSSQAKLVFGECVNMCGAVNI